MTFKNLIYSLTCLSFSVVIGAAVYEHIAVVPQWSAAPPQSLSMFQGDYGLNAEAFWKMIHPLTMLLFVVTLAVSWKSARKSNILFAFIGYIVVIIVTAVYFVPELIAITTTAYSEEVNSELTKRASTWEIGSLIRLVLLIVLDIGLFLGLTKTNQTIERA